MSFSSCTTWLKRRTASFKRPHYRRNHRGLWLDVLEDRTLLSTFTVVNTNDGGPGSLRQAIMDANSALNAGTPDQISFAMSAADSHHFYYQNDGLSGQVSRGQIAATTAADDSQLPANVDPDCNHSWWSFQVASALPDITDAIVIDGYTQPGASANTLGIGPGSTGHNQGDGDNAVLKIELNGGSAGLLASGLVLRGGTSSVRGLVVNNFDGYGILARGVAGYTIAGNFVGTDVSGTIGLGNGGGGPVNYNITNAGIVIASASNSMVGGTAPADRNLISGNAADGLVIADADLIGNILHDNVAQGNLIGTDRTGMKPLGNASDGLMVNRVAALIGGTSPDSRNIISGTLGSRYLGQNGSAGSGVNVLADGARVEGNFIGTDITGSMPIGNTAAGANVNFAAHVIIGGTAPGAGNLIAGNRSYGVGIGASTNIYVQGNLVGTNYTGTAVLGNQEGIISFGGVDANIIIGGTDSAARNVIAGSNIAVDLRGPGNRVQGNYIGADVTGTKRLGSGYGLYLTDSASNNLIGGTAVGAGNVIGSSLGIQIKGPTSGNIVQGNRIGTDSTGTVPLGNHVANEGGIFIESPSVNNLIGGSEAGAGNTIAFLTGIGVRIISLGSDFSTGNTIRGNSMFTNTIGIDLGTDGVTANDPGDSDAGSNNLQNFPVLTSVLKVGDDIVVAGELHSAASASFTLEFFASATLDRFSRGEGEHFLGYVNRGTDASGTVTFSVTLPGTIPVGQFITATATDSAGNTSEFSDAITVKAVTAITWPAPANITYGMALGSAQLDATASVVINGQTVAVTGTFIYAPAAGTVLHVGDNQPLTVTFTPTQTNKYTAKYTTAVGSTTINVLQAPLIVTANDLRKVIGRPNPSFTVSYAGFANGDGTASLSGTLALDTSATTASPEGTYPITPSGLTSADYAITFVPGTLTVGPPAPLTITANDQAKVFGRPNPDFTVRYGGFVNGDDSANLSGALAFDTSATSASPEGTYPITPSGLNSPDYAITFVRGTLTVAPPASPSQSTLEASTSVISGGTISVLLTARDAAGNLEPAGSIVMFALGSGTASGTFSDVYDNGEGKYSADFTGSTAGSNTITATIDGQAITSTLPTITVTPGPASPTKSTLTLSSTTVAAGQTATFSLTARDATGNREMSGGENVYFGSVGPFTDNNDGTYIFTFSSTTAGHFQFEAYIGGQFVASTTIAVTPGPINLAHSPFATTIPLNNGKVLVIGGYDNYYNLVTKAELYDPHDGCWSPTLNDMSIGRILVGNGYLTSLTASPSFTATLLQSGKVLVAGGFNIPNTAELYDPACNRWEPARPMIVGRAYHTATLLPSGEVLVTGGETNDPSSAELYNPGCDTWTYLTNLMLMPRLGHTATLIGNEVLIAGGAYNNGDGYTLLSSAEIFNTDNKTWSPAGSMSTERYGHTATLLLDGKVLVTGGDVTNAGAEVYDPHAPVDHAWSVIDSMNTPRIGHTATLLNSGQVLVTGGVDTNGNVVASAELYDPVRNKWSSAGALPTWGFQGATLLKGNQVLVTGGIDNNGGVLFTAELFKNAHIANPTLVSSNQVSLTFTATDPVPATQQAAFTYTINWGDGTAQNPDLQTIAATANNGAGVPVSHTYAGSGAYLVAVTATDQNGGNSPAATAVVVLGRAAADAMSVCGTANPGDIKVNLNGSVQTFHPTELAAVFGQGATDTYTVNFGSTLTVPVTVLGGASGDTLIANGSSGDNNIVKQTAVQNTITWGSGAGPSMVQPLETVTYSGVANVTINGGSGKNYIVDPGSNTIINGGPGQNTIVITATAGTGVVINGGGGTNTYILDLGSLAGRVSVNNSNAGAANNVIVNAPAGNNTITASGNQVTEGAQTIQVNTPLTSLAIIGGPGADQIAVTNFSVAVESLSVAGGAGSDQITVASPTAAISSITVDGGIGSDMVALINLGTQVAAVTVNAGGGGDGDQVHVEGSLPPQVTVPNAPPVVNLGNSAAIYKNSIFARSASFVATGSAFTATVDYGDGSGSHALALGADKSFSLSHAYAISGAFTVTVRVADGQGDVGSGVFVVTVNDRPPAVQTITAPLAPGAVTMAVSASGTFTDPDGDSHTALWNWGDNTTSSGTVTQPILSTTGSVSGSHTYTTAGVYTVTLTVTDPDNQSSQLAFQYVVIYDPSAGFVTGGGWINSPAGAYVVNSSLTGKANFGFESKYQKGANVPTGNTQFNFKMANLDFHSTSYDWLVVAGAKAQYKGSGVINNTDSYGFMLTAIDGDLPGGHGQDKFRIKIWDKVTGNTIYDNQVGASDTADPSTVLGGGSIVIHSSNQLFDGAPLEGVNLPPLTLAQVRPMEEEAIRLWLAAGANPVILRGVDVRVVDLPGSGLGLAAADTIWLDKDAAGHGWFIDPTPAESSEFRAGASDYLSPGHPGLPGSPAYGKVDLLTVVAHELGHVLGYEDSGSADLMAEYLPTGTRRLPAPSRNGEEAALLLPLAAGGDARAGSLKPQVHALAKDIDVSFPMPIIPWSANAMGALANSDKAMLVALPRSEEPRLVPADKRNAGLHPGVLGRTYAKRVLDAVFAELEGKQSSTAFTDSTDLE